MPRELFAGESKKSALKAANSGKSFDGRRKLSVEKDGVDKQLPLDQARKFSVFEREKITLSIGDRVRFTKNVKHHGHKFLNNELRTVVGIDEGKIIFDKAEIIHNGAALHLDQGIAVTSHASQAKTVARSLSACRFGRLARRTKHNFTFLPPRVNKIRETISIPCHVFQR